MMNSLDEAWGDILFTRKIRKFGLELVRCLPFVGKLHKI